MSTCPAVELSFETKSLRDMCEIESLAIEAIGAPAAEALKHRLSDIRAADAIHEVLAGRPQTVTVNGVECRQFQLSPELVLRVVPNHVEPRLKADGAPDWERIRRIRVISVEHQ